MLVPSLVYLYRLVLNGTLHQEFEPLDQRFRPLTASDERAAAAHSQALRRQAAAHLHRPGRRRPGRDAALRPVVHPAGRHGLPGRVRRHRRVPDRQPGLPVARLRRGGPPRGRGGPRGRRRPARRTSDHPGRARAYAGGGLGPALDLHAT